MGHYDDIIEEREARELERKASRAGMTVSEYVDDQIHREKMRAGEELHRKLQKQNELIKYYLDHREG